MSAQTQTPPLTKSSLSMPALLLRLEGVTVFISALVLYAQQSGSWLMFVLLLLTPDLSMIGYAINPRLGARLYNVAHTYVVPALLVAASIAFSVPLLLHLALIWFAHIGMDRTVGYGLKYATMFKDTHLNRV